MVGSLSDLEYTLERILQFSKNSIYNIDDDAYNQSDNRRQVMSIETINYGITMRYYSYLSFLKLANIRYSKQFYVTHSIIMRMIIYQNHAEICANFVWMQNFIQFFQELNRAEKKDDYYIYFLESRQYLIMG